MRNCLIFLGFIISFSACSQQKQEVKLMSFNIRYANPADSLNYWENRKDQVIELIRNRDCDFVGIQEALPVQIGFLESNLSDYEFVWRTREADPTKGEAVPLLYLQEKWKLISSETFWLSDTPEVPGSNTWKAACNRVTTWGLFESVETGQQLIVCNTHFDHISQEARLKGAQLIRSRLGEKADRTPIVLLGDLNGKPDNPAVKELTSIWQDPYPEFYPDDTLSGTFHAFNGSPEGKRIDYVLVHGAKKISSIQIIRDNQRGFYPSDHFPVFAEVIF
ncbi:MAG: endonuclease/exonuclease/phosphatase family protein [Bacteroidota bacterium]|nr:endonuclease/exonuclease/phosphatase family protein [Bacteroidota bacterium]